MNRADIDAVRLLLEVAPEVFREPVFALKGGTAINPAGELVRARLLVTDQGRILREVAASPDAKHSWLGRLTVDRVPKDFQYYLDGIEAYARFLIKRMEAARNEMLWSPEQARRLQLKESLVEKLGDGPQDVRFLARRFHSMSMEICNDLLNELEKDGDTVWIDGK